MVAAVSMCSSKASGPAGGALGRGVPRRDRIQQPLRLGVARALQDECGLRMYAFALMRQAVLSKT